MFSFLSINFCRRCLCSYIQRNFFSSYNKTFPITSSQLTQKIDTDGLLLKKQTPNLYTMKRFKHRKKDILMELQKKQFTGEEEVEDESDDVEPYEKVILKTIPTIRLDAVVKAGLGLSRNKVEEAFYGSKIRVNENKCLKKSLEVNEDDEIDLVVGRSPDNPDFLIVNRMKLLSVKFTPNGYKIKFIRDKSLIIEAYKDFINSSE